MATGSPSKHYRDRLKHSDVAEQRFRDDISGQQLELVKLRGELAERIIDLRDAHDRLRDATGERDQLAVRAAQLGTELAAAQALLDEAAGTPEYHRRHAALEAQVIELERQLKLSHLDAAGATIAVTFTRRQLSDLTAKYNSALANLATVNRNIEQAQRASDSADARVAQAKARFEQDRHAQDVRLAELIEISSLAVAQRDVALDELSRARGRLSDTEPLLSRAGVLSDELAQQRNAFETELTRLQSQMADLRVAVSEKITLELSDRNIPELAALFIGTGSDIEDVPPVGISCFPHFIVMLMGPSILIVDRKEMEEAVASKNVGHSKMRSFIQVLNEAGWKFDPDAPVVTPAEAPKKSPKTIDVGARLPERTCKGCLRALPATPEHFPPYAFTSHDVAYEGLSRWCHSCTKIRAKLLVAVDHTADGTAKIRAALAEAPIGIQSEKRFKLLTAVSGQAKS